MPGGQWVCNACQLPGRMRGGGSVERQAPSLNGPGSVCDKCRKRVLRRMKTEEAFRNRASSHNSVVPPISPELEIVSPSLNIPQYLVPSLESTHQHELPPALLNNAPVRRDFHSTAPESGGSNVQDDAGAANTGRWGGFYGLPDIFSESLPYHFMETPHLDALLWDSGYNALPFDQFWLAPVPTPTVTLSVPERNEVPLSTENGPVHESPSIPSTPGSPGSNLWHNETFGPASPSTSSYATSTSASASSGLISAGPKSATATPWTPPGYVPEENLSSDCLPGSCAHLDATTQCVTVDDAPFLFKIPKISVTSPAMRNASEKRRKAERLFLCPFTECGHSFTRNGNLKDHVNSHLGIKPYACKWAGCWESFTRKHDCVRHESKCKLCPPTM